MKNPASGRALAALSVFSASTLLPLAAQAADYNYIEGGFIERHDYGETGPGGRVAGAINIEPLPLAVIAEFDGTDGINQVDAGVVFHAPLLRNLDFFGGGTIEHADRSGKGYSDHDTGPGGRIGLRWQADPNIELSPELRLVHLYHDDQISVRLNGLVALAPHLSLQGAVQGGDEQRYEVGLRYDFGRWR
jgi:hypothetical protein